MSETNKILDDIAQLAGGAAGLIGGVQQQIRDDVKARIEEMASNLDLVPRGKGFNRPRRFKTTLRKIRKPKINALLRARRKYY